MAYVYMRQGKKLPIERPLEGSWKMKRKKEQKLREHRELTLPFSHYVGKLVS